MRAPRRNSNQRPNCRLFHPKKCAIKWEFAKKTHILVVALVQPKDDSFVANASFSVKLVLSGIGTLSNDTLLFMDFLITRNYIYTRKFQANLEDFSAHCCLTAGKLTVGNLWAGLKQLIWAFGGGIETIPSGMVPNPYPHCSRIFLGPLSTNYMRSTWLERS